MRHYTCTSILAAVLFGMPPAGIANTNSHHDASRVEDKLTHEFRRFAGSKDNAEALVQGLHNDTTVRLTSKSDSATFNPATGKMGYGNVDIALSLAQASLADLGIRKPTPDEIKAALNGGSVRTKSGERVTLPGVLKLRASGMGWGEVAHRLGFKLGEVMRHHHRHHAGHKHHHHKHADWKHDGKHDWKDDRGDFHRARFDRPDRPDKPERPEKAERPERPDRPERPGKR